MLQERSWGCYENAMGGHILSHDCVRSNLGMIANMDRSDDLCPGTDIDMAANGGDTLGRRSDCDLLKDEAVASDFRMGVNDNAIWVRNEETSAD